VTETEYLVAQLKAYKEKRRSNTVMQTNTTLPLFISQRRVERQGEQEPS
jgi:hypothetical protein